MLNCFTYKLDTPAVPVIPLVESQLESWRGQQEERMQNWLQAIDFKAKAGGSALFCNENGHLQKVLLGMGNGEDYRLFGQLASNLPKGIYQLDLNSLNKDQRYHAFLAWGMGSYQFTPYKKQPPYQAKLYLPEGALNLDYLEAVLRATYLVRDLINTPADDMMPADLAEAATKVAEQFGAKVTQIIGEDLLTQNYPSIHTVGRASEHAPRLIDLRWGDPNHPKVTLIGKGVCFDSGGLDLKNASNMALMKKDMAGGAHALGLAHIIMSMRLPVNLRVLIPAVENAVSGDAFHPGDVIITRKGTTVEVTNTDAEGRLVLCDALYEAAKENPELLLDFTTLTGAARVALGTDISALFTVDETLADGLINCGKQENDPIWPLPIYAPYRKLLDSKVADLMNSAMSVYGGAITAAVFLKEFLPEGISWAHFDLMAWNLSNRPAMPEGGEAMSLRAVARFLCQKYGQGII